MCFVCACVLKWSIAFITDANREFSSLLEEDGASHTWLIFISNPPQPPSILLSYLTCFDRYQDADIRQNMEWIPAEEFIGKYFVWNHTKEPKLNFLANSIRHSRHPQNVLMSPIRIIVLITSVFKLIVFWWGLLLLIMELTTRRGNSNYFLDWGQNPLYLILRSIPPQTQRIVIGKQLVSAPHSISRQSLFFKEVFFLSKLDFYWKSFRYGPHVSIVET